MPDDNAPISPLRLGLDETTPTAAGGIQEPPATPPQPNPPTQEGQPDPASESFPEEETKLVVTATPTGKKFGGTRVFATILGVLLLIGGVAAGVYLTQRQQLVSTRAWDCKTYVSNVSRDGIVSVQNGSTRDEPSQQALVFINDTQVAVLDVPALKKGGAATLGGVSVPQGSFSWKVKGTKDCENSGSFETAKVKICHVPPGSPETSQAIDVDKNAWETGRDPHNAHSLDFLVYQNHPCPPLTPTPTKGPTPTASPSPTSTPTPTVTPTPPPIGAACLDVKAYDSQWNQLASSNLSNLKAGNVVRFTVGGTTTSGSFDKARFTVNGVARAEVTGKRPETDEFFDEYVIPEGTTGFTVSAQIHHSVLGWF